MKLGNLLVAAACILLGTSQLAAAEESAPQPQTQAQAAPPIQTDSAADVARKPGPPDEIICEVRDKPVTGTRIARKRQVCRTRREWLDEQEAGQGTLKKVQEAGRTSNGIKGGDGD